MHKVLIKITTEEFKMFVLLLLLISVGTVVPDTVMINERDRFSGVESIADRLLRGSGNQQEEIPGCDMNGCITDFEVDIDMFVADGWGKTLTFDNGKGLKTEIRIFISDLLFRVPITYMYNAVRGNMFTMYGINYREDGNLYDECMKCNGATDLSYGKDVHGNDMNEPIQNKYAEYSDYSYCKSRNIYKYPWFNFGAPGIGQCTNQPAYVKINMCILNKMAYYFDESIAVFSVDKDASFTATVNIEINKDIRTAQIDSNMNSGYILELGEDIELRVEGWGTLPLPNLHSFFMYRCKNTNGDTPGQNGELACSISKTLVSNSVPDKGNIPRSGLGEYQVLKLGSQELLFDKSMLVGFPDIKSNTRRYETANLFGTDLDELSNFEELNDILMNKGLKRANQNMYKTINTDGVPDLDDENNGTTRNNKKCPFVITSPSLDYLDVIADNYVDFHESYKSFGAEELKKIEYKNGLPDIRFVEFRSLMNIKTSAKVIARGINLDFVNDEGTVNGLTEVKSVIMVNAAGSYTKFTFEYLGSGGSVKISSSNIQLGTQSYYCSKPAEYTLIVSIRNTDGTGNYELCVNDKCIDLSPEYHEPSEGGTDEPGIGGEGETDGYYLSFMKYQFTGIISTMLMILVIILDVFIGVVVVYACAKFLARITSLTVWLIVYLVTFTKVNIGSKVEAAPSLTIEDIRNEIEAYEQYKQFCSLKDAADGSEYCTNGSIKFWILINIASIWIMIEATIKVMKRSRDRYSWMMFALIFSSIVHVMEAKVIPIQGYALNSGYSIPLENSDLNIISAKVPALGKLIPLSDWEGRNGKLEDIMKPDKQVLAIQAMESWYETNPKSFMSLSPHKLNIERLKNIYQTDATNWPNLDPTTGGLLPILLSGEEQYIRHGKWVGCSMLYSDDGTSMIDLIREYAKGSTNILGAFNETGYINAELGENYFEYVKGLLSNGGDIERNDECYVYEGNYLMSATIKEGAVFIRCTWIRALNARRTYMYAILRLNNPDDLVLGDIVPGRVRTTSLSDSYNAATITFSLHYNMINKIAMDPTGFFNDILLKFYSIDGSAAPTISCSKHTEPDSDVVGCQLMLECMDLCTVKRISTPSSSNLRSGVGDVVVINRTLSDNGMSRKSRIVLKKMKKVYDGLSGNRIDRNTYTKSTGMKLIKNFWNSTDYSMEFRHEKDAFTVRKPSERSFRTVSKQELTADRFRSMTSLNEIIIAGEELVKRKKYATFLEIYESNDDIIYYRGNVFESIVGGPVMMNCIDTDGSSLCNKEGMMAKIYNIEFKKKDAKHSIDRKTKLYPRTLMKAGYELNMVEQFGLLPNDRDCTGLVVWNSDGQVTTNEDCAVITLDDWENFAIIEPGIPYKLDLVRYNKWVDEVDERKIRSWTGTDDTEFEARVTTRKGCERCTFSCMQRCSKNVWPGAHWCWWFSWLIIAAGGLLMTIISKLMNIRVNTNFKRYAHKTKAFLKDAGENVTSGNMKFWKEGEAREDYYRKYNKYDKRDKEEGYRASKNSVRHNYKQDLERDSSRVVNEVEGLKERYRNRKKIGALI